MKLWIPAAAATLALAVSATASAAGGSVTYQCQNDKKVSVNYTFNEQGVPTQASATLNGKKRLMKYDLNRSDNVDTFFKDASGYNLSASELNAGNYRNAAIMIMSGKINKTGSVSYMCLNNRRVKVNYAFNDAGVPVKAEAVVNGRKRIMQYDLNRSDNVDTFFKDGAGYNLTSSNRDADNFRQSGIMITAPDGNIVYKDCQAN